MHVCRACYYFYYWQEILPGFEFYVVTRSYSSHPFLCALTLRYSLWYLNLLCCQGHVITKKYSLSQKILFEPRDTLWELTGESISGISPTKSHLHFVTFWTPGGKNRVERKKPSLHYTLRCEIKQQEIGKKLTPIQVHENARPEETLDIQSKWILVSAIVPQEWNFIHQQSWKSGAKWWNYKHCIFCLLQQVCSN